jgi:hypothetical protein
MVTASANTSERLSDAMGHHLGVVHGKHRCDERERFQPDD